MCLKDWQASCEMLRADSRRCKRGPVNKRGEEAMGVQEGRGGPGDKMQGELPAKGAGVAGRENPSEGRALMGPREGASKKGRKPQQSERSSRAGVESDTAGRG